MGPFRSSPHPETDELEELVCLHRFRQVVGGACLDALLAVVLQRLRGDGDDGQCLVRRIAADGPHGLVPVHLRHHHVHEHDIDVGVPVLRMTDSADLFSRASSFFDSSLPVYTTTGTSWNLGWLLKSSRKRSPSSFASSRSSTTVSNVSASSFSKPARPVATAVTSTSSPPKSSEMLRCCAGSSSISSSFFTFLSTKLEMCVNAPSSASLLTGFSR